MGGSSRTIGGCRITGGFSTMGFGVSGFFGVKIVVMIGGSSGWIVGVGGLKRA